MAAGDARVLAVTGTDTGVGKTLIAQALLLAAREAGIRAAGYKPVASGSRRTPQGLRNDDAEALLAASAPGLSYADVNPLPLERACAPHIAAARESRRIEMAVLDAVFDRLRRHHELVIVEGAGGWRVPLSDGEDFADWMERRQVPTLLVVGLRLGAINHALLTADAMRAAHCWAGWVANFLPGDGTGTAREMAQTLLQRLGAPQFGVAEGAGAAEAARAVPLSLLR